MDFACLYHRQHQNLAGAPFVLGTLVETAGSTYQKPGAKILFDTDLQHIGLISGGCLEQAIGDEARTVFASGKPKTIFFDSRDLSDPIRGFNLGCQGALTLVLEPLDSQDALEDAIGSYDLKEPWQRLIAYEVAGVTKFYRDQRPPSPRLRIFGAGIDARPLVKLAAELGYRTAVFDHRSEFLTRSAFPDADELHLQHPEELKPSDLTLDNCYYVVMTHNFDYDRMIVTRLLAAKVDYVGILGPRSRKEALLDAIAKANGKPVSKPTRNTIHGPVGLDLGGRGSHSVALSILAQLEQLRNKGPLAHG